MKKPGAKAGRDGFGGAFAQGRAYRLEKAVEVTRLEERMFGLGKKNEVVATAAPPRIMTDLQRTLMGFRCSDCDDIPKVSNAGQIERIQGRDVQIMHNGLRVVAGGYHGNWMAHLIRGLRGHHEPQEERVFAEVVRRSRHNSNFVELGAFWAYYTLWYLRAVPGSRGLCVEPDPSNREIGSANARLNDLDGRVRFHAAMIGGVGSESQEYMTESTLEPIQLPMLSFSEVAQMVGGFIEVLHLDTQGFETDFLRSIPSSAANSVRFVVASTHHHLISKSQTTHADCIEALQSSGAHILVEHKVEESFSGDGLIVASFEPADLDHPMPSISRNDPARSLFGC